MIETEEQRRWWFATHPQYSSSRRGIRDGADREGSHDKVDPKKLTPTWTRPSSTRLDL